MFTTNPDAKENKKFKPNVKTKVNFLPYLSAVIPAKNPPFFKLI